MPEIQWVDVEVLKANPHQVRIHSRKQIREIAASIAAFGFLVPLLTDAKNVIIAGHGRWEAAKERGLREVPVICVEGLSEAKVRALALAENRIAQDAGWDREKLAVEIPELAELLIIEGLDISVTGFTAPEIDQIVADFEEDSADPADSIDPDWAELPPVSRRGDLWKLGNHRLACGDARDPKDLAPTMGDRRAAMAFLDPPYNVRVRDIMGRGRIKHREFAMASGELTRDGYIDFLNQALTTAADMSRNGASHFVCSDWRHIDALTAAANNVYGDFLNLVVWVKSNAGQGSLYRSQHELIGVFRVGDGPHINNIELGRHGRNRTNVWNYAGVNSFKAGRLDELRAHPTVKPVAMVADAIKDVTRRRDVILDTFCGSGTTILAAERVGRHAFALEIEPQFVDIAIRRWQAFTRRDAVHVDSGLTFEELAIQRQAAQNDER